MRGAEHEGTAARGAVPLDGSVVAGMLGEVFAVDVTLAVARCAACGHADVLARTTVYVGAMGAVVRCTRCGEVLLVVVERPDGTQVSAQGVSWLRVSNGA